MSNMITKNKIKLRSLMKPKPKKINLDEENIPSDLNLTDIFTFKCKDLSIEFMAKDVYTLIRDIQKERNVPFHEYIVNE